MRSADQSPGEGFERRFDEGFGFRTWVEHRRCHEKVEIPETA